MKQMTEIKQTSNQNQDHSEKGKWTFVPVPKELVAKRTDKYVLIKLPVGQSAIVNAVFLRKKETEEKLFMSIPEDYQIKARQSQYNPKTKKYEVVKESIITASQLVMDIKYYLDCKKDGHETAEILSYEFNPLPF